MKYSSPPQWNSLNISHPDEIYKTRARLKQKTQQKSSSYFQETKIFKNPFVQDAGYIFQADGWTIKRIKLKNFLSDTQSIKHLMDIFTKTGLETNHYRCNRLDTGRKLNAYETFRRYPGRHMNVSCTPNLRPASLFYCAILSLSKTSA